MPSYGTIRDKVILSNGVEMPRLGFGVYSSPSHVTTRSCETAMDVGYRHIDTAQYYGNEAEVGQAVAKSRTDMFVTTKILSPGDSIGASLAKCRRSAELLGGYADLFLIHTPSGGDEAVRDMWQALERLHHDGGAKAVGVSNFGIKHIEAMKPYAKVWPPHVNQLELHPWCQQREIVEYCGKNGIVVQAYCPIVRNQKAEDPTLKRLAAKYGVKPNQVLIRYCLDKGWVPLPKSDDAGRIAENANVYGFVIDDADKAALDGLDQGPEGAIVQAVENH